MDEPVAGNSQKASSPVHALAQDAPPPEELPRDPQTERFHSLLSKCNIQEKEIERIQEQNTEYRDKLLKTIRERDGLEQAIERLKIDMIKERDEAHRREKELERHLKAVQDKASAQESHYKITIGDLSSRYNKSVETLSRRADEAEKDKNESVIKFATREAEIMRLKTDKERTEAQLKAVEEEKNQLMKNQQQEAVDEMKKSIANLQVEVQCARKAAFDAENKMKIAEKRADAAQTTIGELKQQCEQLRKQVIQAKELRNDKLAENSERMQAEFEHQLLQVKEDLEESMSENIKLRRQIEGMEKEIVELRAKEEESNGKQVEFDNDRAELQRLKEIAQKVASSEERAITADALRQKADEERNDAEREADECRKKTETLLTTNQNLTMTNTQLNIQLEKLKTEKNELQEQLDSMKAAVETITCSNAVEPTEIEEQKPECSRTNSVDNEKEKILQEELKVALNTIDELRSELDEKIKENSTMKRKHAAAVKELKSELSLLKREFDSLPAPEPSLLLPSASGSDPATSDLRSPSEVTRTRSRASSLSSLDREGGENHGSNASKVEELTNIQRTMVDKIVLLQKKLARRTEKIEFLEEHVRQCLQELQKKTKIIQYYALREEASLLMPADPSLQQVPLVRKGESYALMGSLFSLNSGEKKALQLATEINSRLQAVLEDTLYKNITLKNSVETLSNEVSKLSRENRLLLLSRGGESQNS